MSATVALSNNFDLGFQSDLSRSALNPRAAYRMRDYIPQLEAPLRKRGGWTYASPDFSTLGGSPNWITSAGWLPFPTDGHLIAISNTGVVYQLKRFDQAGGAIVSDTGDATVVPDWPVFWHKTGTSYYGIILGGFGQVAKVPKKYYDTGTLAYAVAPIGGTPPMARMGFSWGDYLVLGNYYDPADSNKLKNFRWAFSAPGNPDSWTLTGPSASTMDFPEEIIAGVPVLNAILAFGYQDCHIITGDIPPPGGNLARKILFSGNGTFAPRSAVAWRSYAIWANASGIWQSDGATLTDLTATGGISVYYRQLVKDFAFVQGWRAVANIYRDHYVLTIRNAANVLVTTLVCDLPRKVWTEWTNINAANFAHRAAAPGTGLYAGDEELFFCHASQPRVCALSTLYEPGQAVDGDSVPVLPTVETPYYRVGSLSRKRIRRLFVGYDMRTSGAAPTMAVSFTLDPEPAAAYTQAAVLRGTTRYDRRHFHVDRQGLGIGLRLAQLTASADTALYSIEGEAHPWEPSR